MRVRPCRRPALALAIVLSAVLSCAVAPAARAADRMSVSQLQAMSEDQLEAWMRQQLGPHEASILASAQRNRIPPRLLATVILNELGDYGWIDKLQELAYDPGSVGIAQINVTTAVSHKLVDLTDAEIQGKLDELVLQDMATDSGLSGGPDLASLRADAVNLLTWEKLNQPEPAIEAAAREISRVFDSLNANLGHTWARSGLSGPIDRDDPYAAVIPAGRATPERERVMREMALARLVAAAYNSPGVVTRDFDLSKDTAFPNARKHGDNAANFFSEILLQRGWYGGPTASVGAPPTGGPAPSTPSVALSIVVLLDASGSMGETMPDGSTRMDNAKASALRVLGQMNGTVEVALMAFYGCGDIRVEVPFTTDPGPLRAKLSDGSIQPSGDTPLASGIGQAKQYLDDSAGGARYRLVVLTDGQESCNGDLIDAVRG